MEIGEIQMEIWEIKMEIVWVEKMKNYQEIKMEISKILFMEDNSKEKQEILLKFQKKLSETKTRI